MKWRGLEITTDSADLDGSIVVEVDDAAEAAELLLNASRLGKHARGSRSPEDWDYPPGLSVSFKANGSVECEVVDQDALSTWVDERMLESERAALADEWEAMQQEAADDAGETLMRDRAAGVA